jgi:FG-GAP-like repeat
MSRSRTGLALGALVAVVLASWTAAYSASSPEPASLPTRTLSIATDDGSGAMTAGLHRLSDFNRDGFADLIARDAAGTLWLYPGNGTGGLQARHRLATGWKDMTSIVTPGDVTGDGNADVLARVASGVLWLYPGNGSSGLGNRRQLGSWAWSNALTNAADMNGDGQPDLLARDLAGHLWLYPMSGNAVLRKPTKIGNGWKGYTILGPGDFSGDGQADILASDSAGRLWLYPGNGTGGVAGGVAARVLISGRWDRMTALVSPGNWNLDLGNDLLARDVAGRLWLCPGDKSSGFGAPRVITRGWQGMTYIG